MHWIDSLQMSDGSDVERGRVCCRDSELQDHWDYIGRIAGSGDSLRKSASGIVLI